MEIVCNCLDNIDMQVMNGRKLINEWVCMDYIDMQVIVINE